MEKCTFSGVQVRLSSASGSPLKHAEAKQEINHPGDHVASSPFHKGSETFRKLPESTPLSNRLQSKPLTTIMAFPLGPLTLDPRPVAPDPRDQGRLRPGEQGTGSPHVIASKGGPGRKPPHSPQGLRPGPLLFLLV